MGIEVLHQFGACSSLIWYDYPDFYSREQYLRRFEKLFDLRIAHLGHAYDFKNYSFFTVGTNQDSSEVLKKLMTDLGFQSTEEVYNKKNETTAQLWTISIPLFVSKVKLMKDKEDKE